MAATRPPALSPDKSPVSSGPPGRMLNAVLLDHGHALG